MSTDSDLKELEFVRDTDLERYLGRSDMAGTVVCCPHHLRGLTTGGALGRTTRTFVP